MSETEVPSWVSSRHVLKAELEILGVSVQSLVAVAFEVEVSVHLRAVVELTVVVVAVLSWVYATAVETQQGAV